MFTLTTADVIRFYGEKLLFMPDNRQIEKQEEAVFLEKKETKNTNSVSIEETKTENNITPAVVVEEVKVFQKEEKKETIIVETPAPPKIEPPKIEKNPFEKGEKIVWKMRPNVACKVVTIVAEKEFKNTVLMGALLFMMEEKCKINRNTISFGVYKNGQNTWDFSDMPVEKAILFADIAANKPEITGKVVHLLPSLSKIALEIDLQTKAMELMKGL